MKNRIFRCSVIVASLCVFVCRDLTAGPPNVLIIVSDDHGYGDVGANGCKDIPTPHLDSLAANGVRFTNGYVSCSYCSPTRAALLTGRYQQRFGHEYNPGAVLVPDKDIGLPLSETILPQRLKAAGYTTGIVGKWHLGYEKERHPMSRGFDEFFGFLGGSHSYVNSQGAPGNPIMRGWESVEEKSYLTDAFGREAAAFIDRHAQQPWFLYLAFNAVHGPMDGASRYEDRFANLTGKRKTYATMLTAMDDAIGGVLGRLREHKIEENTLIFFVADNGGPESVNASDNGPLRGVKGNAWEGGIRVPFMIQWKNRLPAGKVYDQSVIQIDFQPTVLAAVGIETEPDWKLEGVNLLPFLTGEKNGPPHEALYWRFGAQMAVCMGDWKLVKATDGADLRSVSPNDRRSSAADTRGAELYNLRDDVGESNDLAAREPVKVKQLAAAWNAWNRQNIAPRWTAEDAHPARSSTKKSRKNSN